MPNELAQLMAKLDEVIDLLRGQPKPHLTQTEFAKLAGISAKTVSRKIDARLILTVKGRIPRTELAKFTT